MTESHEETTQTEAQQWAQRDEESSLRENITFPFEVVRQEDMNDERYLFGEKKGAGVLMGTWVDCAEYIARKGSQSPTHITQTAIKDSPVLYSSITLGR